jgi:hypothetical protein
MEMPSTGRHVGMLFIPKGKSQILRNKIKVKVRETPTGRTLANLIDNLNPVIMGWRNYYRYATRSGKEFAKHDWLYWRLKAWLGKKHGGASGRKLRVGRNLLLLWRRPRIPALRRIHGSSGIQPPARQTSKCRCRRPKPRDNLPMRCRRSRTRCGARLYEVQLRDTRDTHARVSPPAEPIVT